LWMLMRRGAAADGARRMGARLCIGSAAGASPAHAAAIVAARAAAALVSVGRELAMVPNRTGVAVLRAA